MKCCYHWNGLPLSGLLFKAVETLSKQTQQPVIKAHPETLTAQSQWTAPSHTQLAWPGATAGKQTLPTPHTLQAVVANLWQACSTSVFIITEHSKRFTTLSHGNKEGGFNKRQGHCSHHFGGKSQAFSGFFEVEVLKTEPSVLLTLSKHPITDLCHHPIFIYFILRQRPGLLIQFVPPICDLPASASQVAEITGMGSHASAILTFVR